MVCKPDSVHPRDDHPLNHAEFIAPSAGTAVWQAAGRRTYAHKGHDQNQKDHLHWVLGDVLNPGGSWWLFETNGLIMG